MALSEHIAAMGDNVSPGTLIQKVITARRINGLMNGVRELASGGNLVSGPGIKMRRTPAGVVISAPQPPQRPDTPPPRMVSIEITLDADTAPTSAQINAALAAFYSDDTIPREGDTFRISRVDTHYPEVEVQLTATALGPDWRFSPNSSVTLAEKPWYKITRDISGRVYFEGSASKTTVNKDGVTVLNKTGSKSLTVDPASITADMTVRDLPVLVGSEVKLARVIASAPISQSPPVMLPIPPAAQEYLAGGGIRFLDSSTDAKYITAYLPEIAAPEDQDSSSLLYLEYVPATLPGGGTGFRLRYSSRIVNNEDSLVHMRTDNDGDAWFFDLSEDTQELIEALGEDIITLTERLDSLEEYVEIINEAQDELIAISTTMGGIVDGLQTAVSGATIECDESGVTLTWGEAEEPPPEP